MLRDLTESDLPVLFKQHVDAKATTADWESFELHWKKNLADSSQVLRVILFENRIAGYVVKFDRSGKPEVAYWLGLAFRRKGLATQALHEFLMQFSSRPLYARTAYDNLPSVRVLKKCGFVEIGKDRYFSKSRNCELDEYIWKLDSTL